MQLLHPNQPLPVSTLLEPIKTQGKPVDDSLYKRFLQLYGYVKSCNFEGYDLFDGLNSRLFRSTPLSNSRLCRLALIQFCKRSPVNIRPLLLVPKDFNPKGGGLFLLGLINMYRHTGNEQYAKDAKALFHRLLGTKIDRPNGVGWGYNFDWQARAFHVPAGTPNVVTSVYVGFALLEYYREFWNPEALHLANRIGDFILDEMIQFEDKDRLCFNYIPERDAQVHNANLLAASYLAHLGEFREISGSHRKILKALRFSVADIQPDGAWPYGTKPFHRWVDNFHTAFNIECLINIIEKLNLPEYTGTLELVANHYLNNLFTADGTPKYYQHECYPIDIHVIAEAIVVLNRLRNSRLYIDVNEERMHCIEKRLFELVDAFQDKKGYFYYQQTRRGWNRIPYIRWGQAWMFYALSMHSNGSHNVSNDRALNKSQWQQ